ncbi:nucleoside hydrolase [Salmonella enterica subsp. enterica]|nr:nucleoside hydrolase [Salmonella enterica subsp. enterica]
MALPIIIDCDPGHDDAIALVRPRLPELEVKAITSSAGNQTPERPCATCADADTAQTPGYSGGGRRVKPLMRELIIADNVHGSSLDGQRCRAVIRPQSGTAVELMAKRCARAHNQSPSSPLAHRPAWRCFR